MNQYLDILGFTLNTTGPIFVLVLLGLFLKRIGLIDDRFISVSSRLVFSICLPVLLFTTIIGLDIETTLDINALAFSLAATLLAFAISWLVAIPVVDRKADRGVFVQGSFRGNLGVIGLALCASTYGATGLATASLLMAVMTILYNVLAVVVLTYYSDHAESAIRANWRTMLLGIISNPLILSILAAFGFVATGMTLPSFLVKSGNYIGAMALPLALLGTGAGMSLATLRNSSTITLWCLLMKTAFIPLLLTVVALQLGFSGSILGILFLLFVSPTASASFIMVKTIGGDDALAANLIMTTTLGSIVTASLGIFLLRIYGLA